MLANVLNTVRNRDIKTEDNGSDNSLYGKWSAFDPKRTLDISKNSFRKSSESTSGNDLCSRSNGRM